MGRPFRLASERRHSPVRRTAASENRTVTRPPGRRHLSSRPACSSLLVRTAPRNSPGVVRSPGGFVQLGGLPIETDVSSAVWISSGRRRGTPGTVGALVPAVFEAYARVLHPAVRYAGDADVEVSWAEVAAHNGTVPHALMQWVPVTGSWDYRSADSQPPVWDDAPSEGHLPVAVAARLAAVLRR